MVIFWVIVITIFIWLLFFFLSFSRLFPVGNTLRPPSAGKCFHKEQQMNIERAILFWSGNCLRIFCIRSHIFCWTDILRHGSYATSQLNSRTNQNRLVPVWFRTQLSVLCYAFVKFRPHPIFPHLGRTKIRRSHDLTKFNSIIFCFSIHILPKDHMQEPLPYVTISDRSNKLLSLSGIMARIAAKIEFLVILARSLFRVIAPIVFRSFLS